MGIGVLLLVLGGLVSLAAGIWMIVLAFRESVLWGLAVIFIPFAGLVFAIKFWSVASRPFLIALAGGALWGLGTVVVLGAGASRIASQMAEMAETTESGGAPWEVSEPSGFLADPTPLPTDAPAETPTPGLEEDALARLEAAEAWTPTPAATPTPTSLPDYEPATVRDMIEERMGQRVVLRLASGKWVTVTLQRLEEDRLEVVQRMGGGSMVYTITLDEVRELREE